MSEETLEVWLRGRVPRIPAPFLPHLLEGGEGPSGAMELSAQGAEAMSRALERPGRNRDAAFLLLSADAFFTYACEAVVQERDVQAGLEGLLERLGGRFS
jgi:hypothetical protein